LGLVSYYPTIRLVFGLVLIKMAWPKRERFFVEHEYACISMIQSGYEDMIDLQKIGYYGAGIRLSE